MKGLQAIGMAIAGIGMATALFSSGRTTVAATQAVFKGSDNVLYTAESGKLA